MSVSAKSFEQALYSGADGLPQEISVASAQQFIPAAVLDEIDRFITLFDRVTSRPAWVREALALSPDASPTPGDEYCFFSAWDFHLPPGRPHDWQLIEFNDNGSGFLFASRINRLRHRLMLADAPGIQAPETERHLGQRILAMIHEEARALLTRPPGNGLLILDDADSLKTGKFRDEHRRLAELVAKDGWRTVIATPQALVWTGSALQANGTAVDFVVNRSTDFLWQSSAFDALKQARKAGRVYVAPNPFSYATRSDKRLFAWLSRPERDNELGILGDERALFDAHVPATWCLTEANVEVLAARKHELVFKPAQRHAGLGVLDSRQVGRSRLRRLLARGELYVAQQRVDKEVLEDDEGHRLWCDLRVWSWRDRRYLLSGRASREPGRLDLQSPGGWLATFAID